MYNEKIEKLIKTVLADGSLTEQKKQSLFKKVQEEGFDIDEFEIILDAYLQKTKETTTSSTGKSSSKRVCPNCGAIISTFMQSCPECGCEFDGVEASTTSEKFAELLNNLSGRKRLDAVRTFPIPDSKQDLFELTLSLKALATEGAVNYSENNSGSMECLQNAFLIKYFDCIKKIKNKFADDPVFSKILLDYKRSIIKLIIKYIRNIFKQHPLLKYTCIIVLVWVVIRSIFPLILNLLGFTFFRYW